jgi:DNA-binding response OmpR family regulator
LFPKRSAILCLREAWEELHFSPTHTTIEPFQTHLFCGCQVTTKLLALFSSALSSYPTSFIKAKRVFDAMMDHADLPTGQQILTVDDNDYTLSILHHTLTKAGYQVMSANSGEQALALLQEQGLPDLAIVDYHMAPGMSGFDFCQAVHQFSDLPVIMLTAVQDEDTIINSLENHAEDFVTKPFSPAVLAARARRVLKRVGSFNLKNAAAHPNLRIDERLVINFPQQQALIEGKPVALTPIETKLLYLLVRRAGQPVATDFILRRIWPQEMAFEDRLHVHIHRLRRKLEDKAHAAPYIVARRGQGYVFVTL